jgi:uncharacterized membrane protein
MKLSRIEWAVIALTLLGALLRFWNIGFQTMNYDEEFTISFASPSIPLVQLVIKTLTTDFTPPLYYIAAHFSMIFFGMTATAIRLPSVIIGVFFTPVMYFVGKEYRDDLFGLLAAGFTAIWYNGIFYSKYGRAFMMGIVFVAVAFCFFMRALKGDRQALFWFSIFALASVWTHLYTAIPIGMMILYLLWKRGIFTGISIIILGSVPLIGLVKEILINRTPMIYTFGSTWQEIIYLTPLDLFTYSAFIIVPIIVWSLWTYRSDSVIRIITLITSVTWVSMIALAVVTPIVLHYAIYLVPMLIVPLILPFYDAIRQNKIYFHHHIIVMVFVILEAVQIAALAVVQRSWVF